MHYNYRYGGGKKIKFVRFLFKGEKYYGLLKKDRVIPIKGDPFSGWEEDGSKTYSVADVKFLAPCQPSKIIAVGLNYYDHARELNMEIPEEPVIFLKPPTSVIGPEDYIILPEQSGRVDYEAELAVVIQKEARNVSHEIAKDVILGYTCGNDITARDLQKKDGQWTRAKSFDTFLPLGPVISDEFKPGSGRIELKVDGEVKQGSNTDQMIFDVYDLVVFISGIMTLKPGDVIITGTPGGIGPLKENSKVEVYIEGIGNLVNYTKRGD
ncbi:fumarylacetoacetate hydrolase family protein [Halothermothrix orenii]|uniref:5-carboxymethyl-2-hydroxymuconate Delta-isomerase n=1 Tax=Halothermothrix orenii (strain H 168 / OCM 544 / DSM 9562) TaxID=373903 RepID=B8CZZ0_HALOH|nr:fumarylacetoacetate hydrolase family protein [Halothermothrix orenii]ACL70842.1 5-carboxymethyl-2-hydroxymuconate Delta-isomerase [Halothermothrix orenii H 168]